jgi:tRNA threonylcarbamoyladenosine biosynthesis protein TsaE
MVSAQLPQVIPSTVVAYVLPMFKFASMIPESVLQISYSLDKISAAAHQFWQYAHSFRIICFSGDMGAGKTTFVHALCDNLGVNDTVSSPTFALVNEYHFDQNGQDKTILHMDWYRLRNTAEAIDTGMEDALLNEDVYCFVEWAERAEELIPLGALRVRIEVVSETDRVLTAEVYLK